MSLEPRAIEPEPRGSKAASRAARPSLAALGLTPLARIVIAGELLLCTACGLLYPRLGLHFVWSSAVDTIAIVIALWLAWTYFVWQPGRSRIDWMIAERCLILALLFTMFLVHPQAQYVAFALKRPLVGSTLAAADRWIGLEVPDFIRWTAHHPTWRVVLSWCYGTLLWQFWLPVVALWTSPRDRADLWEYVGLFYAMSVITLLFVAVWPAEPPLAVYPGAAPLLNQTRVLQQITDVRSGGMTSIDLQNLDGLISLPSFHAIGAIIVAWVMRHKPIVREALIVINSGLIAATLLLGMHYLVDVLAGVALAGAAILMSSLLRDNRR